MGGPADRFGENTAAVSDVRRGEHSSAYLHEYTGVLAETGERVRLFTLPPDLADVETAVEAFAQVSDQWYNASANANILAIRDRGTEPRPWVAVPDHGGDTLAALQPALSPDAIETAIAETADALRTLGLYNTVHGHLSPDDIYLPDATDGTANPSVLVGGLGLEAAIQTAVGEFELTPYTAPELVDGSTQPTEGTDVYGLGAVTYFALTGQSPIEGEELDRAIRDGPSAPPSAYDSAISADLDDVVMQALSTRPADRYDSPYAFSRAFLSVFVPADFRPDDEAETADGSDDETETADAARDGSDDDSPSDDTGDAAASDDTDETSMTRRAAVGLLGIGAVGGAGWYLSRGQLALPDQTAADPGEETGGGEQPTELSVSISVTPTAPAVGETVTFAATATTVGEGATVESYEWAVGDEAAFVTGGETRTQSFGTTGEQTVRLRITDSRDRTATATTTLTVESPSGAPMFQYNAANTGANQAGIGPQTAAGEQWTVETGDGVFSSPAVVDGTVYVGSGDGNVYALAADDGAEQWSYRTGDTVGSSPAVIDGTVYVGSFDNSVYALSAADGTEQWSFQTGGIVFSSPAVVGGTVYVGSNDGNVYALSTDDGTEQWAFETENNVSSSPAVVDGTVYVGSNDGNVYALSADDGTEQWTLPTGRGVYSSPAVVDGTVYVGSFDSTVYALSAEDGTEQWSFETSRGVYASPAVADGTAYVKSIDGTVYALSADDGTEQWSHQSGDNLLSSTVVIDSTVYVGGGDANVYALAADDGTERWSYQTGNTVSSSPAVVDGTVYVGSSDNSVYALAE